MGQQRTKRTANHNTKSAPPSKVAKKDESRAKADVQKTKPLLEPVLEIIAKADTLPEACKSMLIGMISHSICTPFDERHEVERRAVEMVGEVVAETVAKMQREIDAEVISLSEADAKQTTLDKNITEAESSLAAAVQVLDSRKVALADASTALQDKKHVLESALATQHFEEQQRAAYAQEKEAYDSICAKHFKPLRDEELERCKADEHYNVVYEHIQKLEVDASLMTALPTACVKPPSARGAFDQMVFQEIENKLGEHIHTLKGKLAAGVVAATEQTAIVQSMQSAFTTAEEAQRVAADDLAKAQDVHRDCSNALSVAKEEKASFLPLYASATKAREDRVAALKQFQDLNVACFVELRDKLSGKDIGMVKESPDVPKVVVEIGGA